MITKQACQDESVVFSLFPKIADDIIIFSRLVEEHLVHLEEVFKIAQIN